MMGPFALTILGLALAGAVASWIVGAIFYVRCLSAIDGPERSHLRFKAVVAWPFTIKHLKGGAAEHAAVVNKAVVAFIVCAILAAATISLSTNYNRITK